MAGWGVNLVGFSTLMGALDELKDVQLADDTVYIVGTNVEYSVYVEFGTSRMPAQPYLFNSAREAERQVGRIAAGASNLEEAVQKVALSIERKAKQRVPVDTGNLRASIEARKVN